MSVEQTHTPSLNNLSKAQMQNSGSAVTHTCGDLVVEPTTRMANGVTCIFRVLPDHRSGNFGVREQLKLSLAEHIFAVDDPSTEMTLLE